MNVNFDSLLHAARIEVSAPGEILAKRNVIVAIQQPNLNLSSHELQRELCRIIESVFNEYPAEKKKEWLEAISISAYNPATGELEYRYGNGEAVKIPGKKGVPADITVKTLKTLGTKFFPVDAAVKEGALLKDLFSLLTSLWPHIDSSFPEKGKREEKIQSSLLAPVHFFKLLELLQDEIKREANFSADLKQLEKLIDSALAASQACLLVKSGEPSKLYEAARALVDQIKAQDAVTIPLGYFRGSRYVPLMLHFTKDAKKLYLDAISLDSAIGRKIAPAYRYEFDLEVLAGNKPSLLNLFQVLLHYQLSQEAFPEIGARKMDQLTRMNILNAAAAGSHSQLTEYEADIESCRKIFDFLKDEAHGPLEARKEKSLRSSLDHLQLNISYETTKQELVSALEFRSKKAEEEIAKIRLTSQIEGKVGTFSPDTRDIAETIHEVIQLAGAKPLALADIKPVLAKPDQFKILFTWIKGVAPEIAKERMLALEIRLLHKLIAAILFEPSRGNETLAAQTVKIAFLEKFIHRVQKHYQKEFGDRKTLEKVWDSLSDREHPFAAIRKKILELKRGLVVQRLEELKAPLNLTSIWGVHALSDKAVFAPARPQTAAFMLSHSSKLIEFEAHAATLNREGSAAIDEFYPQLLNVLKEYLNDCKALYRSSEYRELAAAATALLDRIPTPGLFWEAIPASEFDFWSESIASLVHYLFESKLKLGQLYIMPKDVLNLLNARAVTYDFMQRSIQEIRGSIFPEIKIDELERQIQQGKIAVQVNDLILALSKPSERPFALGVLGKLMMLKRETVLTLAYSDFSTDSEQALYLLRRHPFFRYSYDPKMDRKAAALIRFFERVSGEDKIPICLDHYRAMQSYVNGDRLFLDALSQILLGFDGTKTSRDELWATSLKRDEEKNRFLPSIGIDMRRIMIFSQILLHPESTIFKGFKSSKFATEEQKWMTALVNSVSDETGKADYEMVLRKAGKRQAEELLMHLYSMGPLELMIGADPELHQKPAINIGAPHDRTDFQIGYQPVGVRLLDFRDPFHGAQIIGQRDRIPKAFLTDFVAKADWKESKIDNAEKKREQNPSRPFTEVRMLQEENEESTTTLTPAANAKLRSLVVESQSEASPLTLYNVFDFIFSRSYLLENENVQRILEQALLKTGVLQSMLLENPSYIEKSELPKRLRDAISFAMNHGRPVSAAFLLSLSQLLKSHIQYALYEMQQKPNEFLVQFQLLKKLESLFPTFQEAFPQPISGLITGQDYIVKVLSHGTLEGAVQKYLFTHYLSFLSKNRELKSDEYLHILIGYGVFKNSGTDSGNPIVQDEILHWIETFFIPHFINQKDDAFKNPVLTALAHGKWKVNTQMATWNWKLDRGLLYTAENGTSINLRNGQVKRGDGTHFGFNLPLPPEIAANPDDTRFADLFGKGPQEVISVPSDSGKEDILCFQFSHDQREFRIEYHPDTKRVEILLRLEQRGSAGLYRYQKIKASESIGNYQDALFVKHGLWIERSLRPAKAVVILNKPRNFKPDDILNVTLDTSGKVVKVQAADGREVYPDQTGQFLKLFAFADPGDVLFILGSGRDYRKVVEIRFISKGISLLRVQDDWQGKGDFAAFKLLTDPKRLFNVVTAFGSNYNEFLMPLVQIDETTKAHLVHGVIFPIRFNQTEDGLEPDKLSGAVREIPALKVYQEIGRVGFEAGQWKSTTAGFLYLAYHAYAHGNYDKAARYLIEAQESAFSMAEVQAFEAIVGYIRDHKDSSTKGIAFRLKAEIAIQRFKRDRMNQPAFHPDEWRKYLNQARVSVQLYGRYMKAVQHADKEAKKHESLGETLKLTQDEIDEFEQLIKESLTFLVDQMPAESPFKASIAKSFTLKAVGDSELDSFVQKLAIHMKPPAKEMLLENMPLYPTLESFLGSFWSYVGQIASEKLTLGDWRLIYLQNLPVSHLEDDEAKMIDIGRLLLIRLAKFNGKLDEFAGPLPLENQAFLKAIQEKLESLERELKEKSGKDRKESLFLPENALFVQTKAALQDFYSKQTALGYYDMISFGIRYMLSHVYASMHLGVPLLLPAEATGRVKEALKTLKEINAVFEAVENRFPSTGRTEGLPEFDEKLDEKFETSALKIEQQLNAALSPFTQEEKVFWRGLLEHLKNQANSADRLGVMEILQGFHAQKIEAPALRHEAESLKRVLHLEAKMQAHPAAEPPYYRPQALRASPFGALKVQEVKGNYLKLLDDCFAGSPFKPSMQTIDQDFACFTDEKSVIAAAFIKEYEKIRRSDNNEELQRLISSLSRKTHQFVVPYQGLWHKTSNEKVPDALGWYLQVAASCRIREIDSKAGATQLPPFALNSDVKAFIKALDQYEKEIFTKDEIAALKAKKEHLKKAFLPITDPSRAMESEENRLLCEAIEKEAMDRTTAILSQQPFIRNASSVSMQTALTERSEKLKDSINKSRGIIFGFLRSSMRVLPTLKAMLEKEDIYSEADILEKALDLYKANQLPGAISHLSQAQLEDLDDLQIYLTHYLYEATEFQQISKAIKAIAEFRKIPLPASGDEEAMQTYKDQSKIVSDLLQNLAKRDRYLDPSHEWMIEPALYRRQLVAEYRSEMVARDAQTHVVKLMMEGVEKKKNPLILLPPGAGKSKWITPEAAQIIASKYRKLVVVLVTEELLHISGQDMDVGTRELYRQAGHIFDFSRSTRKDPSYLIDEYYRLLQVKQDLGYVISTIGRLAALQDEIFILGLEIAQEFDLFCEKIKTGNLTGKNLIQSSDFQASFKRLRLLQKERHWLQRIEGLYKTEDTVYIADEVDDIFSSNRSYNYCIELQGVDPMRPASREIAQVVHDLMVSLLKSDSPLLADLQASIWNNEKSALAGTYTEGGRTRPIIRKFLRPLAQIAHQKYGKGIPLEEFTEYVLGNSDKKPQLVDSFSEEDAKNLNICKHLLSITFESAALQKAGVSFGLDAAGFTVVPKAQSREIENVRYGDEYDLIVYQFLYHAIKPIAFEFFKEAWPLLEEQILSGKRPLWEKWYQSLDVDKLSPQDRIKAFYQKFSNTQESWQQRVDFFRSEILTNRLKVYRSQVQCNAQDVLHHVTVVGASGTVGVYSLPDFFDPDVSVYSRQVAANTFFSLKPHVDRPFDLPVKPIRNAKEEILSLSSNMRIKFIINLEAVLEDMSPYEVVKMMRQKTLRPYCFVTYEQEGGKKVSRQMIWPTDKEAPIPFFKAKVQPDTLVYFAPADIRGTDWPIPLGEGSLFSGAGTDDELFLQAAWRARRMGQGHEIDLHAPELALNVCREKLGKAKEDPVTYGEWINDIKKRTLEQKAKLSNFGSRIHKIQSIIRQQIDLAMKQAKLPNSPKYWDLDPKNNDQVLTILSDLALDSRLVNLFKPFYVKDSQIDFKADLEPTREEDTFLYLLKQYDAVAHQAKGLRLVLSEAETELNRTLREIMEKLVDNPAMLAFMPTLLHPTTKVRLSCILDELKGLEQEIENSKLLFIEKESYHRANLSATSPVGGGAKAGSNLEQVQEQAHQQQQQMQMAAAPVTVRKEKNYKPRQSDFAWIEWMSHDPMADLMKIAKLESLDSLQVKRLPDEIKDCGFSPSILLTANYQRLRKELKIPHGELMGRLVFIQNGALPLTVLLIDQLDYELGVRRGIDAIKKAPGSELKVQVASLLPATVTGNEIAILESTSQIPAKDPNFYQNLVQVKVLAGTLDFITPEEREALKTWAMSLDHNQKMSLRSFICSLHGTKTITQISGWSQSPLSALL